MCVGIVHSKGFDDLRVLNPVMVDLCALLPFSKVQLSIKFV